MTIQIALWDTSPDGGGIYAYKLPIVVTLNSDTDSTSYCVAKVGRSDSEKLASRVACSQGRAFLNKTNLRPKIPGCNKTPTLKSWKNMGDKDFVDLLKEKLDYQDIMFVLRGCGNMESLVRRSIGSELCDLKVEKNCKKQLGIDGKHYLKNGCLKASGWKYWLASGKVEPSGQKLKNLEVGPHELIVMTNKDFQRIQESWKKGSKDIFPLSDPVDVDRITLTIHGSNQETYSMVLKK